MWLVTVSEAVRRPAGQSGLLGQTRLVLGKAAHLGAVQLRGSELAVRSAAALESEPAAAAGGQRRKGSREQADPGSTQKKALRFHIKKNVNSDRSKKGEIPKQFLYF